MSSPNSYPIIPTPEPPTPKVLTGMRNNSVVSIPVSIPTIPEEIPQSFTPIIPVDAGDVPPGFVPTVTNLNDAPPGFVPHSPLVDGAPSGFVPSSPAPPGAPLGFVSTSPIGESVPNGFMYSPALPDAPPGFVPNSPLPIDAPSGFLSSSPRIPDAPPGFIPGESVPPGAPPGFVVTSPAPPGAPAGFVHPSPSISNSVPPGFVPAAPLPQGAPPGFMPSPSSFANSVLPKVPIPTASPSLSMTGALPVFVRSEIEDFNHGSRSPRVSFSGPNAGFNSRAASDWDTRLSYSPRPVPGPEFNNEDYDSPQSERISRPVIPDASMLSNTNPVSSRRSSRINFDADPAMIPMPPSTSPSLARNGRATSQGSGLNSRSRTPGLVMSRSASARSGDSINRYPYKMNSSGSGLPPSGLTSPYSRRLETHPENDDESVNSSLSDNTLTTPPSQRISLINPPSPVASLHGRPLSRSDRDAMFLPPDPVDAARVTSSIQSKSPSREPDELEGALPLRNSASHHSLASQKSYARFNKDDYVDPAILTSGRSKLLPLPPDENTAGSSSAPISARAKRQKKKKGR